MLKTSSFFSLQFVLLAFAGSIEVGITAHEPDLIEFPATMTNLRPGMRKNFHDLTVKIVAVASLWLLCYTQVLQSTLSLTKNLQ